MNYIPEGYFIEGNCSVDLEQIFYQKTMVQYATDLQKALIYNFTRSAFLECSKGSSKKDIKEILYKYCDKEIDFWCQKTAGDLRFKDCIVYRQENQVFILFNIINSIIRLDSCVDFLDEEINK